MSIPSNVYDISMTRDPARTYSKSFDEKNYSCFDEWFDAVHKQEDKLHYGIFAHKGSFYFARFKTIDLTERDFDPITDMTTTVNRIIKFKWSYELLK